MALNKAKLKDDILSIITDMENKTVDSKDEYATRLSNAIDAFVKTGKVAPGISVATTGSATTQTGKTTTEGTIN